MARLSRQFLVPGRPRTVGAWLRQSRFPLLAAAVAALTLSLLPSSFFSRGGQDATAFVAEAVNDHIRVLLRAAPTEGVARPAEILAQLIGRLEFTVPPIFPGDGQVILAGGAPSYVLEQKVAGFYYRKGGHLITLFVLPARGLGRWATRLDLTPQVREHRGYRAALWRKGSFLYTLISDLAVADLLTLGSKIQEFKDPVSLLLLPQEREIGSRV